LIVPHLRSSQPGLRLGHESGADFP
jgi:hypothetical protein